MSEAMGVVALAISSFMGVMAVAAAAVPRLTIEAVRATGYPMWALAAPASLVIGALGLLGIVLGGGVLIPSISAGMLMGALATLDREAIASRVAGLGAGGLAGGLAGYAIATVEVDLAPAFMWGLAGVGWGFAIVLAARSLRSRPDPKALAFGWMGSAIAVLALAGVAEFAFGLLTQDALPLEAFAFVLVAPTLGIPPLLVALLAEIEVDKAAANQ